MILDIERIINGRIRIPRESGDDPFLRELAPLQPEYSPRERG